MDRGLAGLEEEEDHHAGLGKRWVIVVRDLLDGSSPRKESDAEKFCEHAQPVSPVDIPRPLFHPNEVQRCSPIGTLCLLSGVDHYLL